MTDDEAYKRARTTLNFCRLPTDVRKEAELRGFVVPIPKHDHWDAEARRKAIAAAKRSFKACLKAQDY
ncbi:MAG TPA: hypothetical protein VN943_00485 [Candidatus Acidoferrum sp.]|nr:hypothetical protein [Candidatus Acidoferrum sp.]